MADSGIANVSSPVEVKADAESSKKCNNIHAVINVILGAIGLGIVSLPSVVARCGWIGGAIILLIGAVITDYLVCKLHTAVSIHPTGEPIYTYEKLGKVCYGRVGQVFTLVVVHVTMTGACSGMLLLLGQNTQKIFPQLSDKAWTCIWAAVCTPLSWLRSFKEISYVSSLGLVGIFAVLIIIAAQGIVQGVEDEGDVTYDILRPDILAWTVSFGNSILAYQIANITPTLIRDMKTPTAFPRVASIGLGLTFVIYLLVGCCGYYGYGRDLINNAIINSIAPAGQALDAWGYCLVIAILFMCFPHYLVMLLPVVSSVEYAFKVDVLSTSLKSTLHRIAIRTCFVGVTLIVAIVVPSVEKLVDLLGVFTMVVIAMIFPAMLCLRMRALNQQGSVIAVFKSRTAEFVLLGFLTLLAVVIMGVGGYSAIKNF